MKKVLLFSYLLILSFFVTNHASAHYAHLSDTLRLLAIGNSFSEDAIENYLYELAASADKKIIIGNLYIGGAPIDLHVRNANENNQKYAYRKIALDGKKTTTENVSIAEALEDEKWTHISLQQASPLSGKFDVIIQHLPQLLEYVKPRVSDDTKLVYHQTWAYQQDSNHDGFANYDRDQLTMYHAIASTSKQIKRLKFFDAIIPAGTAIQNARTSTIGDHYTRDGYHLNLDYGRFTAACVWYEMLYRQDVRKNQFIPPNVSTLQADIAKEAAHKAAKKPFKVSRVKQ